MTIYSLDVLLSQSISHEVMGPDARSLKAPEKSSLLTFTVSFGMSVVHVIVALLQVIISISSCF